MTDTDGHDLGRHHVDLSLSAGCIGWRDQRTAGQAQRTEGQCQRELRFAEVSKGRADRPDRDIPMCRQEGCLFGGGVRSARRCRVDRGCIIGDSQGCPETFQNAFNSARGRSGGMTGDDVDEPCKRLGAPALGMRFRLQAPGRRHPIPRQSRRRYATRPMRSPS